MAVLRSIPLFLPAVAAFLLLAVGTSRRIARRLRMSTRSVALMSVAIGVIAAATLTPSREALAYGWQSGGVCDLSRLGLLPARDLATFNDFSLNVLLFIPLGVALGTLPKRRLSFALIIAASLIPLGIELAQLIVRPLDRSCQAADVFDNLTGLMTGLVSVVLLRAIASVLRRRQAA